MSSNLKVNTILPSVGSNIGIGTNGGELNVDGGCKVQVGTALTLGHSIGLQYATQNLHSEGFEINQINASGIITATSLITNGSGGINISASGSDLTMNSAGAIFTGNGGNATDPIVRNVSDTNTGFFYPAADTIAVTTGGGERLRIDSYGALLVGTNAALYTSGDMRHEIKKNNSRTYTAPLMAAHSHLLLNNSDTTAGVFWGDTFWTYPSMYLCMPFEWRNLVRSATMSCLSQTLINGRASGRLDSIKNVFTRSGG